MIAHSNDEAAGAVLTLVSVFLLSGILFVLIGYGIDKVILTSFNLATTMPSSQVRYDVVQLMLKVFQFEPILILLGVAINAWVSSIRTQSGDVNLSAMMVGAAELIIITLVVIGLVMFGGMAIESVITAMNHFVIGGGGGQPGLFSAVQYSGMIFYGVCFLGLVGACIQYLILCVQTVDVSSSY